VLDAGAFEISIPQNIATILKSGSSSPEFLIGIRPEDVRLSPTAEKGFVESSGRSRRDIGNLAYVTLQVGNALVVAQVPPTVNLNVGDKVFFQLDSERIHVFDKKTESLLI